MLLQLNNANNIDLSEISIHFLVTLINSYQWRIVEFTEGRTICDGDLSLDKRLTQ